MQLSSVTLLYYSSADEWHKLAHTILDEVFKSNVKHHGSSIGVLCLRWGTRKHPCGSYRLFVTALAVSMAAWANEAAILLRCLQAAAQVRRNHVLHAWKAWSAGS